MEKQRVTEAINLGLNISRVTVSVVDILAGRGTFKGEELSAVGRLRDQCLQFVQLGEEYNSSLEDEGNKDEV